MIKKLIFIIAFLCAKLTYADQLIIEPDAGRAPILSALQNAKTSIDLVMYGLTDNELIHALIASAKRGIKVRILLEPHPYENENENQYAITLLRLANIELHDANPTFQLTHQKSLITDHQTAWIMNFNFTKSAFNDERNFAIETSNPDDIHEMESVFQHDIKRDAISVTQPHLAWSPNNSREKLIATIQSAQVSLQIYAQDVTDYQIVGELAKAAQRGVNVELITSAKLTGKNKGKFNYLTRAGVKIHFSQHYYIHAKVIIVDRKTALLGSTNLTQPSIEDNRELSVITQDPQVLGNLESYFNHDKTI